MSPRQSATLTMENVLLAMLNEKPMHGYELYQELCRMKGISLIWNIKQSLLYAILEKLEGNGYLSAQFVEGDTYPRRKCFHLTDSGKEFLQDWLSISVRHIRDFRQEFLAKLIVSRIVKTHNPLDLVHKQRAACETWLIGLNKSIQTQGQESFDEWLVYSYRLRCTEALIDWLKELEKEFSGQDPYSFTK